MIEMTKKDQQRLRRLDDVKICEPVEEFRGQPSPSLRIIVSARRLVEDSVGQQMIWRSMEDSDILSK